MALINCPECNKEISDKAKACPNCGYELNPLQSNNRSSSIPKFLLIVFVISALIFGIVCLKCIPQIQEEDYYANLSLLGKELQAPHIDKLKQLKLRLIICGAIFVCSIIGACISGLIIRNNNHNK